MPIIVYHHKTQYHETDQMGIIHHANYIRWFEEARSAFMEQIGFPYTEVEKAGIYFPVTSVTCEYKKMVRFAETIRIESALTFFNGIRMHASYRVLADDGTLRATGESHHCFLNREGRPVAIQKKMPALYEALHTWLTPLAEWNAAPRQAAAEQR